MNEEYMRGLIVGFIAGLTIGCVILMVSLS